jgi:hypothetical protein
MHFFTASQEEPSEVTPKFSSAGSKCKDFDGAPGPSVFISYSNILVHFADGNFRMQHFFCLTHDVFR